MGTDLALASPRDRQVAEPLLATALAFSGDWPTPLALGAPALTKVSQLQLAPLVDEQVLRLQVPVQDLAAVAVGEAPEQLEHENLRQEERAGRAVKGGSVSHLGDPAPLPHGQDSDGDRDWAGVRCLESCLAHLQPHHPREPRLEGGTRCAEEVGRAGRTHGSLVWELRGHEGPGSPPRASA